MKNKTIEIFFATSIILLSSLLSTTAIAQYSPPQLPIPRDRGAPRRTTGGGSRGCESASAPVDLALLIPTDHTAITASAHPTFYWSVSNANPVTLRFTLVEPRVYPALVNETIEVTNSGIVSFAMPADAPQLEEGKEYRWTVSVICDPNRPSTNIVAKALIQRAALSTIQVQQLSAATAIEQGNIYAQGGYWYDALEAMVTALITKEAKISQLQPSQFESLMSLLEGGEVTHLNLEDWQSFLETKAK